MTELQKKLNTLRVAIDSFYSAIEKMETGDNAGSAVALYREVYSRLDYLDGKVNDLIAQTSE